MIVLEKLLLLKSVTFFKQMPEDLLIDMISTIVKERLVPAGHEVLSKNSTNSTMYIIVSGRVKVHNGDVLIIELGEREIFGELSALTNLPAVSSISTLTECLFLTITSHALYELMDLEPGMSKGIIQALCTRNQNMAIQIQNLLNKL
jgi:CRP/FNR family cyclic AMP-dependent transcriptional regulator